MRLLNTSLKSKGRRIFKIVIIIFATIYLSAYVIYPWLCRSSASRNERTIELPGDGIVQNSISGYTLAKTIKASSSKIWPWLAQVGQGRGGFYTREWVENIMGADIRNADSIIPKFQSIAEGDSIRLTPDPYFDLPGQYLVAAQIDSPYVMVFRQILPNGSTGTWTFILKPSTRLIFRRRSSNPSFFDEISIPGYYFMDMGMLSGIKKRYAFRH